MNEVTRRIKWFKGVHPIKEGPLVLLREDNVPSMQSALSRVIRTYPGSAGIVRAVTIKTATNMLDRSVKRLVPLPYQLEDKDGDPAEPASTEEAKVCIRSGIYHVFYGNIAVQIWTFCAFVTVKWSEK